MTAEEQPIAMESYDSDSSNDESSANEETENPEMNESEVNDEIPKKFDLSKINQRMEEGPPSSSDEEEEDDENEENQESSEDEVPDDEEGDKNEGAGWADAMSKVLNIGKNAKDKDKPLLLSKAKLDVNEIIDPEKRSLEKASVRRAKKKVLAEMGRTKPDIVKDKLKEKRLSKMATRGVVQLFNAVRDQQKTLKTSLNKAGLSTTKRDKVFKNLDKDAFLDVLSGKNKSVAVNNSKVSIQNGHHKKPKIEEKEDDSGTWSVLKDNFMMGAKMRDWDKESDSGDE